MKANSIVLAVLFLFLTFPLIAADKVLVVVSSSGFDFGELAQSWLVFSDNGYQVDVASPKGGAATPEEYEPETPYATRFLAIESAKAALANTRPIHTLNASDYRAVFVIGGKGAMFDLPNDGNLQKLIATLYENGGVVGAVCHGPAALVNVKLRDGAYLVAGRKINAFTEEEENAFAEEWIPKYPFMLERELRNRGARFEESGLMLVHVARDGRLVTGQNPFSTPRAAETVISALGRTPRERQPWTDEATILLIEELLDTRRSDAARTKFTAAPKNYQADLIAMYGSFVLESTPDAEAARKAVLLLDLADEHFAHPKVQITLAKALVRAGDATRAKNLLRQARKDFPQSTRIAEMLEQLERDERNDETQDAAHRGSH